MSNDHPLPARARAAINAENRSTWGLRTNRPMTCKGARCPYAAAAGCKLLESTPSLEGGVCGYDRIAYAEGIEVAKEQIDAPAWDLLPPELRELPHDLGIANMIYARTIRYMSCHPEAALRRPVVVDDRVIGQATRVAYAHDQAARAHARYMKIFARCRDAREKAHALDTYRFQRAISTSKALAAAMTAALTADAPVGERSSAKPDARGVS